MAAVYTIGGVLVGSGTVACLQDGRWGWAIAFGLIVIVGTAVVEKIGR